MRIYTQCRNVGATYQVACRIAMVFTVGDLKSRPYMTQIVVRLTWFYSEKSLFFLSVHSSNSVYSVVKYCGRGLCQDDRLRYTIACGGGSLLKILKCAEHTTGCPPFFHHEDIFMLRIADMQLLREAYRLGDSHSRVTAFEKIGQPTPDALVEFALEQMSSPDRNIRVLMLRVLREQRGERAMRGVLTGLHDDARRVCAVAIQACPNFLAYADIVVRLEAMAVDASLKRKLRRRALSMLAGDEGRLSGDLTEAVAAALGRLMQNPECRFVIVFGLARLPLASRTRAILERFTQSDDSAERSLAQRALSGEYIIHIDNYAQNEAQQRAIMQQCEIAHGRMYYWLPRAGLQTPSE